MTVTWNPSDKGVSTTLSGGDLSASITSWPTMTRATLGRTISNGGKYYFEVAFTGRLVLFGISKAANPLTATYTLTGTGKATDWAGGIDTSNFERYGNNGSLNVGNSHTYVAGKILQVAVDFSAGKIWFGYDNTWFGSGVPSSGTGAQFTNVTGGTNVMHPAFGNWGTDNPVTLTGNFSGPFAFTPPSGFVAWDPDIVVLPVGQSSSISGGFFTPSLEVVPSGVVATGQQGNLVGAAGYGAVLAGQQVGVSGGVLTGNSPTLLLTGQQAATTGGVLISSIAVGNASTTLSGAPVVSTAVTTTGTADPVRTGPWSYHNTFMAYEGFLRGVGEVTQHDAFGNFNFRARASDYVGGYQISQREQLLGSDWSSSLSEGFDYNNHGDSPLATFTADSSTFGPWYLNSPTSYQFDYADQTGGYYSIGLDGSFHFVFSRIKLSTNAYYAYNNTLHPGSQAVVIQAPSYGLQLVGLYAHTVNNAYVFYDNGGLAYRRWNGASFGSEVVIGTTPAKRGLLTVVRTGYGDTVYLVYRDSASNRVVVVVFDAVTEVVSSNTPTTVSSSMSFIFPGTTNNAQDQDGFGAVEQGHRPIAEVANLSSGTSVTQFVLYNAVINLSWTSGTVTSPTLTLKTAPTTAHSGFAPGWETLEVRGDTVQHILYDIEFRSSNTVTAVHITTNDASGTGSSWSSDKEILTFGSGGTPMPPTAPTSCAMMFLSGFGEAGPTYLFHIPVDQYNASSPTRSFRAWVDFWGGLSVSAFGSVGSVSVTIGNGVSVPLTGRSITGSQGVFGIVSSSVIALAGQSVTAQQGVISFGILIGQESTIQQGQFLPQLQGAQTATQQGALGYTISIPLAGQVVAVQQGVLTPIKFVALAGQSTGTQPGVLVPVTAFVPVSQSCTAVGSIFGISSGVTLTGQLLVSAEGAITPAMTSPVLGQRTTLVQGALIPNTFSILAGLQLAAARGAFGYSLVSQLGGQGCSVIEGFPGIQYDCNVFPRGVQARGEVGEFPTLTNVPSVRVGNQLWVTKKPDEMPIRTELDLLFVDEEPVT